MSGATRAVFVANGNAKDGLAGIEGSYWTIMGQGIAQALAERGHDLAVLNIARPQDQAALFPMLADRRLPDAFVLFNFLPQIGLGGGAAPSVAGLFGTLPCRIVCICLDHPVHLAPVLREQSALVAANPPLRRQRWFAVMEPEHVSCVAALGIAREQIFVMPQGGPRPTPAPLPLAARTIPFLFAGTIGPLTDDDAFARGLGLADPRDRQALKAAVAEALDGNRDVFASVCDHFAASATDGRVKDLYSLATIIDKRARLMRRRRLLLSLRGWPIHFCGDIDPTFLRQFPDSVHRGRLSFAETIALTKDTRVVINDTINLRSSALIRFFYAAAEGCVLASETNGFLAEAFPPDRAMVALDGRAADNSERVRAVVADPASLQPLADAGRERMAQAHTWSHRLDGLVAALEA